MIENEINIVLAADNNYAQHVAVVAASILMNTQSKVCLHVLSDGIAADKVASIESTVERLGGKVCVYDLSSYKCFDGLFTSGHISKAAYFRLDIANVLPEDVEKVIYIDVDLVVLQDVAELWNIDLQGMPLAAVPDYGIMASKRLMKQKHEVLGLPLESLYFNSGVVIMDLKEWRKQAYAKAVIALAASGKLPHHDQDALNKVFMDKWTALPLKWNVIPPVFNLFRKILCNGKLRKNAIAARRDMAIMHFAGRYKPWEFTLHESFNEKYYFYLQQTAFAEAKMPQPSKNMQGKSIARQMARLKLADFWQWLLG
ncbi:MAG: glycosyltransferase family 8 protein [Phascolarctobacterium sp.]|nr:glycosyltransferase family 8 protein [Phascolarctobacterium sp.]